MLKNLVLESRAGAGDRSRDDRSTADMSASQTDEKLQRQIKDLKSMLGQRDAEIAVLVNMVKQGKTADDVSRASAHGSRADESRRGGDEDDLRVEQMQQQRQDGRATRAAPLPSAAEQKAQREKAREEKIVQRHLFGIAPPADPRVFDDASGVRLVGCMQPMINLCFFVCGQRASSISVKDVLSLRHLRKTVLCCGGRWRRHERQARRPT